MSLRPSWWPRWAALPAPPPKPVTFDGPEMDRALTEVVSVVTSLMAYQGGKLSRVEQELADEVLLTGEPADLSRRLLAAITVAGTLAQMADLNGALDEPSVQILARTYAARGWGCYEKGEG